MSISAVGGSAAGVNAYAGAQDAEQPKPQEELTTVTTHCNKEHKHTPACPHTVSTRPAPGPGESGHLLDTQA